MINPVQRVTVVEKWQRGLLQHHPWASLQKQKQVDKDVFFTLQEKLLIDSVEWQWLAITTSNKVVPRMNIIRLCCQKTTKAFFYYSPSKFIITCACTEVIINFRWAPTNEHKRLTKSVDMRMCGWIAGVRST